jgi:hypothetical protein
MGAKVLQKPQIIEIIGSTIRIAHPDISNNVRTYLSSTIAAAGTAMTVQDNNSFADNDWFIVGEVGDQETEEGDVNGAVTRGTSLTVTNTLKFGHELDAPVTKIYERGIKIYGAATDGGVGTLIASIDVVTTPIADAKMIEWNKEYTEYTLISTDTAYAYYFVKFTDGTTDSSASDYVLATGAPYSNSVEYIIQQALKITNSEIDGNLITREDLIKQANDCQTAIQQFKYQDSRSGEMKSMNWDFEVLEDKTSLTALTGEHEYALSGLTVVPKYENERSIISIRLGSEGKFEKQDLTSYDDDTEEYTRTDCNGGASIGDVTLTVDSNVEFDDSGTLYSGANIITYTGKSSTTGFTGIPASGTGSIEATIADNDPVWQGIQLGLPDYWTYFDGNIVFNRPFSSDYNAYPLKIRYFKKLTALIEATDTIEIPFTNVFQYYLASWIERRKGNDDKAVLFMQEFKDRVLDNALASSAPTAESLTYYNFVTDY